MKSKKVLGIVFLVLILALYGCGGSDEKAKVKVDTEEGKVEVSASEGKVEVNAEENNKDAEENNKDAEENNKDAEENEKEENKVEVNTENTEVKSSSGGKGIEITDYKEFAKYKVKSIVFENEDEDGYQINYITSATKEEITEHYKELLKDAKDLEIVDQMGMAVIEAMPKEDNEVTISISEINGEVNVTFGYYAGE